MQPVYFPEFRRNILTTLVVLLVGLAGLSGQNPSVLNTVSPYSRYGLGDFQFNGGVINTALGGGGIGYRNDSLIPQYINLLNPASLTSHQLVNYEVSISSNTVRMENATQSGTFNRSTLGHFAFAFPVTKSWGAAVGLIPYSAVGYNVGVKDSVENVGSVTYKYEGSGGISQVFMAHAVRPFGWMPRRYILSDKYSALRLAGDTTAMKKKLNRRNHLSNISVGVNASYLFGSLINIRRNVFPDSLYTFNTKITKYTTFRDVYASGGIQYTFRFRKSLNPQYVSMPDSLITEKKWFGNEYVYKTRGGLDTGKIFIRQPGIRMTVGAVFALPMDVAVSYDLLAQTYKQVGTVEQIKDTIVNNNSIPGRVSLPLMAGVGFALKKDHKWAFQADYTTQMWEDFSYLGVNGGLKNSQRITAGFQLQPRVAGRGNFMQAVQYRVGVKYYQTALELRQTQLSEFSGTFGMAFPLPYRTRLGEPISRLSFAVEAGQRGTTDNALLKETFIRVSFGLTINDRWFMRYKLD